MKKLTTEEFIAKAKKVHGDKYDYSLVEYLDTKTKVKIICSIHGEFEQTPNNHLSSKGCIGCGGNEKLTLEEFINNAKKKHDNKYDYSLVDYKNNTTKVKIICPIHGIFKQKPNSHLNGNGCLECGGTKKLTAKIFIERSKKLFDNKYDYSLVDYKNNATKVKIICPIHGVFEQIPNNHLKNRGCNKCSGKEKSTTDEFTNKAKKIHGNKYDYSLVVYKNVKTKVKIICPIHGVFKQTPNLHLFGKGCRKCGIINLSEKKSSNTVEFINKAKKIHGNKYDYSLVVYKNAKTKVKIICPNHNVFEQMPNSHLNGNGCLKCIGKNKTTDEFIKDAIKIHGNKYDYSLVDYKNSKTKIKIICSIHGIFEQKTYKHLSYQGCPKCNSSKGEMLIETYLKNNNIKFINQKRFKDCRNKMPLPFDFYLNKYNLCIEYDGEHHFKENKMWGGEKTLNLQQIKDEIKTKYCEDNSIKLIRIPYWEKDNIEEILNKELGIKKSEFIEAVQIKQNIESLYNEDFIY